MAGTLIASLLLSGEGIGYYFANWNSNPISISVLVVLVLLLSDISMEGCSKDL